MKGQKMSKNKNKAKMVQGNLTEIKGGSESCDRYIMKTYSEYDILVQGKNNLAKILNDEYSKGWKKSEIFTSSGDFHILFERRDNIVIVPRGNATFTELPPGKIEVTNK